MVGSIDTLVHPICIPGNCIAQYMRSALLQRQCLGLRGPSCRKVSQRSNEGMGIMGFMGMSYMSENLPLACLSADREGITMEAYCLALGLAQRRKPLESMWRRVVSSSSVTIVPTTLEWVGSVIIFLLFYMIGCVSKAIVTYRGLPMPANTLDWVFTIVFSSLTYCLEMYQDEAAYAWPSVFQTNYQPSLYSVTLITSSTMIISGYFLVLLWNWVPKKPPTELPLPPSLDYIHFISCKTLLCCFTTFGGISATFNPMQSFLRLIRRSVLVCVAFTSRFLNAMSITITAWGSVLHLFRSLGQAASSALIRVGFIPLF
ncbi:uncharacterized protein LACBIDRAFT_333764 [Laccaria bicolor S238N-H82]|uniref:Predicted protein n=1 Tax=Laccaria bicolor (strain S238N-H82 / ATCC MYA-4686) TaxID=486041 RepID=B0DX00_LACBS|nr:uncharacterized protein LACBIDRAFT_333764 [Laccaria bicolor S238N-H82]EDR00848.1 predicted protein [Laccaria bicolor S238N-H82]|eukprot:XP_001888442.1 predicted protein [Laccaria bicolor S238N-H82]